MNLAISQIVTADSANRSMGVRMLHGSPDGAVFQQAVAPHLADHRGRMTLASISVLIDAAVGSAAYLKLGSDTRSVVAGLSVSMADPISARGTVEASGAVVHLDSDAGFALTECRVTGTNGKLVALVRGRTAVVGRAMIDPDPEADSPSSAVGLTIPPEVPIIPSTGDTPGIDLVRAMVTDRYTLGRLMQILDPQIRGVEPGSLTGTWMPAEWMINGMGSVQGGVLLSVAATLTELTAQTLTEPHEAYQLLDIDLELIRSPTISAGALEFHTDTARKGRRLSIIDCELRDAGGRIAARSHATIALAPIAPAP